MTSSMLLFAVLLAVGNDPTASGRPFADPPSPAAPTLTARAQEPPVTPVMLGDIAPDFSFQGYDGRWRKLGSLLEQGHVLLVFGANAEQLRALEGERHALLDRGILAVAVLDEKPGRTWSLVRDLGLEYTVLSDPRRVIATQFDAVRANASGGIPAWFVLDRSGVVRSLGRGALPSSDFTALAAKALDLPAPGAARSTSR